MSGADIKKWDGKYQVADRLCTIQPDQELIEYQSILPGSGRALDLACGLGKNTLFLAQQGLTVTALDGSAEGLKKLQQSAAQHHLEARIHCLQADLDTYVFPESRFDLIVVVRYLNRSLFAAIARALKPGGLLIYKTFNHNILRQRPGFNPAYTIETDELINSFSALEVLADNSGDAGSESAFMLARKPAGS